MIFQKEPRKTRENGIKQGYCMSNIYDCQVPASAY